MRLRCLLIFMLGVIFTLPGLSSSGPNFELIHEKKEYCLYEVDPNSKTIQFPHLVCQNKVYYFHKGLVTQAYVLLSGPALTSSNIQQDEPPTCLCQIAYNQYQSGVAPDFTWNRHATVCNNATLAIQSSDHPTNKTIPLKCPKNCSLDIGKKLSDKIAILPRAGQSDSVGSPHVDANLFCITQDSNN